MSDTTAPAADATTTPDTTPTTDPADTTTAPAAEGDATDWQAEAEKWKALSRKNEANAKSNADAAKKLADIEAAQLSETEKLTKRVEAAEARAAELESTALRNAVAAERGVPAELLSGSNEAELRESADRLVRFRGPAATTDFGAGKTGTKDIGAGKTEQISREQLKNMSAQEIVAAKAAGKLNSILGHS